MIGFSNFSTLPSKLDDVMGKFHITTLSRIFIFDAVLEKRMITLSEVIQ